MNHSYEELLADFEDCLNRVNECCSCLGQQKYNGTKVSIDETMREKYHITYQGRIYETDE